MQKSKQRTAMAAYDSLGRMFILESRFRLIAKQQLEEQHRERDLRNQLHRAYRLQ